MKCKTYDAECINPTFCNGQDACCAGDPACKRFERIDGSPVPGSMVGIRVNGWITAARGTLTIDGKVISQSGGRCDLAPLGSAGIRVHEWQHVRCDWYGNEPPMIEWSEI